MKQAMFWERLDDGRVQCHLCPHNCRIRLGKEGICKNKKNLDGTLYASRYGEITALAMDPIEKKPLYHFHPGSEILSVGTFGCNFSCDFCQNWRLWDGGAPTEKTDPGRIVEAAKDRSFAIAYTYNEPYMSYEFVTDCASKAKEAGIKNVMVTNGFFNPEPLEALLPYIDAMNIDIKSIRNDFYKRLCKGKLDPVKKSIERAHKDCLVELTNLVITGENDSEQDIRQLVSWVASLSPDIPMHFSAYRPMYKMTNPPTPVSALRRAYEIASEKLNYVYVGNVILNIGQDSLCPRCGVKLVERSGYRTRVAELSGNRCGACGNELNFIND